MYIRLIRNKPQGNAITGRLVIDGRWFCYTLERKGVEIPALCYHVAVTQSPKFKRLLPLVTGVPRTPQSGYGTATPIGRANGAMGYRQGIRIHRGSKPEHSSGCVLVVGDNKNDNTANLRGNLINDNTDNLRPNQYPLGAQGEYSSPRQEVLISPKGSNDRFAYDSSGNNRSNECEIRILSKLSSKHIPVGCRSAADVEQELTSLILKAQQEYEEIILEVSDFRAGTEYGYNTPCPPELQKP